MIWDTWYMPHGIMVYGKWYMVYGPLPLPHIHHSHEKCIGIAIPTLKDFTGILIASFEEWKNSTFHPGAMLWNHHPHIQRINMDILQCLTLALTRTLQRIRWGCHLHLRKRVRWGCNLHHLKRDGGATSPDATSTFLRKEHGDIYIYGLQHS